jgi:serine/threonine protein kinase
MTKSMCMQVLTDCHERGLVHGDVKASSVVNSLDKSRVTLVDFGAASMSKGAQCLALTSLYNI